MVHFGLKSRKEKMMNLRPFISLIIYFGKNLFRIDALELYWLVNVIIIFFSCQEVLEKKISYSLSLFQICLICLCKERKFLLLSITKSANFIFFFISHWQEILCSASLRVNLFLSCKRCN